MIGFALFSFTEQDSFHPFIRLMQKIVVLLHGQEKSLKFFVETLQKKKRLPKDGKDCEKSGKHDRS